MGELTLDSRGLAGTIGNPTLDSRQSSQRISSTLRATTSFGSGTEIASRVYLRRDHLSLRGGFFGAGTEETNSAMGAEITGSATLGEFQQLSGAAQIEGESLSGASSASPSWVRTGLLLSDEFLLFSGLLSLIPSVRFDRTGPFNGFSPKLGALLYLPFGFELRGNLGRAYRAPSFLELYVAQGTLLPNPDLQPEQSTYADVALAHRTRASFASAGFFYSSYENLISYEYYPPLLAKAYNFNSAQAYGLEIESEARPWPIASALLGYTLLFTQNLRDDPRYYLKELPYRPRHRLYLRLSAGPSIFRPRAELSFQSEQFFNRTQTLSVPSRAIVNVGVSSQPLRSPELTLSLEMKNAFDVQTQDVDAYPLPGRAFYLTLRFAYQRSAPVGPSEVFGGTHETH
jgi:iron complex outermembrane receptor protein